MGRNSQEDSSYTQPTITGLEAPKPEETELTNCLILGRPHYKDTGKKQEWTVTVHAQPSIFQPDMDTPFLAQATSNLDVKAQRKTLKPGDRVTLIGVVRVDTIAFPTGEMQTIHRITLTQVPQMLAKEKRVSTTVYEQHQRR